MTVTEKKIVKIIKTAFNKYDTGGLTLLGLKTELHLQFLSLIKELGK